MGRYTPVKGAAGAKGMYWLDAPHWSGVDPANRCARPGEHALLYFSAKNRVWVVSSASDILRQLSGETIRLSADGAGHTHAFLAWHRRRQR